jgi:hypothetical protein
MLEVGADLAGTTTDFDNGTRRSGGELIEKLSVARLVDQLVEEPLLVVSRDGVVRRPDRVPRHVSCSAKPAVAATGFLPLAEPQTPSAQ